MAKRREGEEERKRDRGRKEEKITCHQRRDMNYFRDFIQHLLDSLCEESRTKLFSSPLPFQFDLFDSFPHFLIPL